MHRIKEAFQTPGKMFPILICILLLLVGLLVGNIFFARQQTSIHITPMDVIEILQREGYQVVDVTEHNEQKNLGIIGDVDYYISFSINDDNKTYTMLAIQYESWEKARMVARNANKYNRRYGGEFDVAFSYGRVCIMSSPSSENLGKEILALLNASN